MRYYVKEFNTGKELADFLNGADGAKYLVTQFGVRRKPFMETSEGETLLEDVYYAIGQEEVPCPEIETCERAVELSLTTSRLRSQGYSMKNHICMHNFEDCSTFKEKNKNE